MERWFAPGLIWKNVTTTRAQIITDITHTQLPQVSWVIPDGGYSDHALRNNGSGPSWVASVVNTIGKSAYWSNTAIIITWTTGAAGTITWRQK
jgi:phospholipase C